MAWRPGHVLVSTTFKERYKKVVRPDEPGGRLEIYGVLAYFEGAIGALTGPLRWMRKMRFSR